MPDFGSEPPPRFVVMANVQKNLNILTYFELRQAGYYITNLLLERQRLMDQGARELAKANRGQAHHEG